MKTVGNRKQRRISFHASGELLAEGMRFNDELHRSLGSGLTGIPKGVYRFASHEEQNKFDAEALANHMAHVAKSRRAGSR